MITLTLCARCGYKMLSPSSDDLVRAAKKVAQREKFHFAPKPYEYCPHNDCDHSLAGESLEVAEDEMERAIAQINDTARVILSLRKGIDEFKPWIERFPSDVQPFIAAFSLMKARGVDASALRRELILVVEEYREVVNSFANDVAELNEGLSK